jgi:hypothetical protein
VSDVIANHGVPAARGGFWNHPKLDLWLVWWTMPIFYNIFAIAFFVLAKTQPPPPATWTVDQVIAWQGTHGADILLGNFLWIAALGFTSWHIGLIAVLLNRMSISRAFSYAYVGIMAAAALPGGIFFSYGYSLIVLRPDRDPIATEFLYDFANLTFMGSMGVFFVGSFILCVAILLDKNRILPKWFGYACVWNLTTEFTIAPCWIYRDGPLAWNGAVSFNFNMVIYGVWQVLYIYVFYKAIKTTPHRARDQINAVDPELVTGGRTGSAR